MTGTQLVSIPVIYRTYKVANIAAMNALTGMRSMEVCYVDDTLETYRYSGAAWELISGTTGITFKDNPAQVLALSNITATTNFTEVDITSDTSGSTKAALLQVIMTLDSYTNGAITLILREKGTTPANPHTVVFEKPVTGGVAHSELLIPVDTDQILEYNLVIGGTCQIDVLINVMGYIE